MKVYIITKESKDHLGQTRQYTAVVDESFLKTAITNAELEGYTVVSIQERK